MPSKHPIHHGHRVHIRCRRCGRRAYHLREKRCAACGYGASPRLRRYSTQRKVFQRARRVL
ncbi:MAG TPA: 50S ribosomal protein L37e [Candidatus Bathyarchaeota archaeon]|nr:50S ribosomal protein L37e [Candidatus Bathyarchaeota archaeon]